jgi:hypothetical protein
MSYLILFYVIILPQIASSLYFEEELQNKLYLKIIFGILLVYLMVVGFLINKWIACNGLIGIILISFSIRAGRVCIFMEYIAKSVMLVGLIIY